MKWKCSYDTQLYLRAAEADGYEQPGLQTHTLISFQFNNYCGILHSTFSYTYIA
jgi:hypothetical protein